VKFSDWIAIAGLFAALCAFALLVVDALCEAKAPSHADVRKHGKGPSRRAA
jgi:hypothetical protein